VLSTDTHSNDIRLDTTLDCDLSASLPPAIADAATPDILRVLLVESDERLGLLTTRYLQANHILVTWVRDGETALATCVKLAFDMVLIDAHLPRMDGLSVCGQLRGRSTVPILMLTTPGEENERVQALDGGADDCMAKPFSARELLARVRAHARRARSGNPKKSREPLRFGCLEIDPTSMVVKVDGRHIHLTSHEFKLLVALAEQAGQALSREELLNLVQGSAEAAFDRSIDIHVSRLRHKLEVNPRQPRMLKTVRGAGYLLAPNP